MCSEIFTSHITKIQKPGWTARSTKHLFLPQNRPLEMHSKGTPEWKNKGKTGKINRRTELSENTSHGGKSRKVWTQGVEKPTFFSWNSISQKGYSGAKRTRPIKILQHNKPLPTNTKKKFMPTQIYCGKTTFLEHTDTRGNKKGNTPSRKILRKH